jgi:hypothetical protein
MNVPAVFSSSSVPSKPRPAHRVPVQRPPLPSSGAGGVFTSYDGGKYSDSPRIGALFLSRMDIWIIAGLRQLCFQFKLNLFCKKQTPCCVRPLCMVSFTVSWHFIQRTWRR